MSGRRSLLLLTFATYAFFSATMGVTSIIARYSRFLGFSVSETGLMFSLTPLVASLLRLPVGVAADRVGGRLFIVGGPLLAASAAAVAMVSSSLGGLMAARGLQGAALAFFVAPSIYAASVLRGVAAARAIAVRSAAIAAASSTAPYIAGLLVDAAGYWAGFAYAALMGLAAAAASALLPLAAPQGGQGYRVREALEYARRIAPLFAASLADGVVFLGFQSLPQTHLKDLGYAASVFGLALALQGAAGIPFRLYASRLATRVGCVASMGFGYLLASTAMAVLTGTVVPPWVYVVGLLYGAGLGLVVPSEQLIIVSTVPERIRNTLLSMYTLAFDIGGFIGSTVLGVIAQDMGYHAGYTAMLAVQLASLVLISSWGLLRGFRRCRL
jgi:predicted MFS family arabinose efflux permease